MHTTRLAALALALTGCPVSDDADDGGTTTTETAETYTVHTLFYDYDDIAGQVITPFIGDGSEIPPLYQINICIQYGVEYDNLQTCGQGTWVYHLGYLCDEGSQDALIACFHGEGFTYERGGDLIIRWIE